MGPEKFVGEISSIQLGNSFNPYRDRCEVWDLEDAPSQRRGSLGALLEVACNREIDAMWIGRDLGYRGGRRTGLALTDDVHVGAHAARWGLDFGRATVGQNMAERTARVVWDVLAKIERNVFLWNVFPFHPHDPANPFSNRAHSAAERAIGEDVLVLLIEMLEPARLIAIGNDAARSAKKICPNTTTTVRHPSYGGQKEFTSSMFELYQIDKVHTASSRQPVLL